MKKLAVILSAAMSLAVLSGCVCDGSERSFREIDRKYADSGWSAAAVYIPIIGPAIIAPVMMGLKNEAYYKVLLKLPETETYEVLRHSQRFNFMYYPRSMWKY